MRRNPDLIAASAELASHGVLDVTEEKGRKHIKLRFVWNGEPKLLVVPSTPSERWGGEKARQNVRRLLGVDRVIVKSARARKRKAKPAPKPRSEIPALTCGKDPWAGFETERVCIDQFGIVFGLKVASSCRRIEAAGRAAAQRIQEMAR